MYCAWRIPCTSEVHPVFNPVAPYGYLLSDMLFVYGRYHKSRLSCLKLSDLDWSRHHPLLWSSSASHPAGPHGRHAQKTVNRVPIAGARECSTQFAQQLETTVTAPPLVGCVVWSLLQIVISSFQTVSSTVFLTRVSRFQRLS